MENHTNNEAVLARWIYTPFGEPTHNHPSWEANWVREAERAQQPAVFCGVAGVFVWLFAGVPLTLWLSDLAWYYTLATYVAGFVAILLTTLIVGMTSWMRKCREFDLTDRNLRLIAMLPDEEWDLAVKVARNQRIVSHAQRIVRVGVRTAFLGS